MADVLKDTKMHIRYSNTLEDLVAFNAFHAAHSPTIRKNVGLTRWAAAILVVALTLMIGRAHYFLANAFGALIGGAIAFLMVPYFLRWNLMVQVRRILREGSNKGIVGEHELEILDDGLLENTEFGEAKYRWAGIERVPSTPLHAFIYVTSVSALIVPRGSILEGDFDAFLQELSRRVRAPESSPS